MLSNHSQSYGIKTETFCFRPEKPVDEQLAEFATYEAEAANAEKSVLVEKTPRHVHRIQHIFDHVLNSKFIVCLRNPLDVVASLRKRNGDLGRSIQRYLNDNLAWLPFANDPRVATIRYEDLVRNTEAELKRLCAFIGIPFEGAMLDYHQKDDFYFGGSDARPTDGKDGENHVLLRNWQVRQPITDMTGQWRKRLSQAEYREIKEAIHEIAAKLGYSFDAAYMQFAGE